MKYIKTYENTNTFEPQIGDYVILNKRYCLGWGWIDNNLGYNFDESNIYIITHIDNNNYQHKYTVENIKDSDYWFDKKERTTVNITNMKPAPEYKIQAIKFNL